MKQTITAKLKLHLTPEQKRILLDVCVAYRNALSFVLERNLKDKTTNVKKLHRLYYYTIRKQFNLPAQLAINVYRQAADTYQTLWAQYKELKRRKSDSKRFKEFWDKPPKAKSSHARYTLNRTFSIKPDGQTVSLTTLNGRLKDIKYTCWNKHQELLSQGKIGDATLWYDKAKKTFYLLVPVTIEIQEQTPKQVIGVDVGERNLLAVASTTGEKYLVPTLESWKRVKERYHRLRSELMSKGTCSAKRKLAKLSRREKRFTENVLHVVSKQLVLRHKDAKFVLEDLTLIRENRITYRGKDKEARRQAEQWPFASLQNKIIYKAQLYYGIAPVKVDPHYTSKTCPVCGHVSPDNRPDNGELFVCQNCGYSEHADIVGAINITLRELVKDQQTHLKGLLVNQPNALR